jgi:triacylglycerol lipase
MTIWYRGLPARRRRFVAGVALLAVAAACVLTVTILGRAGSSSSAGYPSQRRPGPVLLVPGYGGSTAGLEVLARRIRATGRAAVVIDLPGYGTDSLIRDAGVLNRAVNRALRGGAPSVDVIGYSAGGVTTLLWAREDDGDRKARRVITLGAPFHGTTLATAAQGFASSACPAACTQLIPGSRLLAGLAAGVPARLPWLSLWTTEDKTVTPPASARLAGAIDVPIQSVCPQQRLGHSQLPTSPVVAAMIIRAIGPGPMARPVTGACGT